MTSLPSELKNQSKTFNAVYLLFKFDVPSFSPWLEIHRFSNGSFCWIWAVQNWYFANFGYVKIDPISSSLVTLDRSQLFYWVLARHAAKTNPKKNQELHIGSGASIFSDSVSGNQNWFPQSINRPQRFGLLFLPVTRFSDVCDKIMYLW